ncbi:cytochrome c553 [Vibrio maritimus]|uniref:Cytochrome c553 n=1 Tax=Vibrio maritimus TaxID=990268 RepID=A0A090T0Q4_9VIBR|nr:cytochrome c553 [Vibrio maritimus]
MNILSKVITGLTFSLVLSSASALASQESTTPFGDVKLGEMKAPSCVFCHNPNGAPNQASYPNLNGQDPLYLFNAMNAYLNDERSGAMAALMKAQLQNLTEQDLRDVAAFYSSK